MKKKVLIYLLLIFSFVVASSCDNNLRTMSVNHFIHSTFGINIDKRQDSIIMEERNFPGFENRGEGMVIINLKSPETIKSIEKIAWSKCIQETLNSNKHPFQDVNKVGLVVFDLDSQLVEIRYKEDWRNVIRLKNYLKSTKLKNLYYSVSNNITDYGFTERKVLLYDKDRSVLFLIFDNRRN